MWLIGIVFGFLVFAMFPFMFSPVLFPLLLLNTQMDLGSASGVMIIFIVPLLLYFLTPDPGKVFTQASLRFGILDTK